VVAHRWADARNCRHAKRKVGFVSSTYAAFSTSVCGAMWRSAGESGPPQGRDQGTRGRSARPRAPRAVRRPAAPSKCQVDSARHGPRRGLAVEPTVLLLASVRALEPRTQGNMRDCWRRLHDEVHVTTVFVPMTRRGSRGRRRDRGDQRGSRRTAWLADDLLRPPATISVMRFLGPVTQLGESSYGYDMRPLSWIQRRYGRVARRGTHPRASCESGSRCGWSRHSDQVVQVTLPRSDSSSLRLLTVIWCRSASRDVATVSRSVRGASHDGSDVAGGLQMLGSYG